MRPLGFSTGALAKGDFRLGLDLLSTLDVQAVELSALRDRELEPLIDALGELPLGSFSHISLHAPSSLTSMSEQALVAALGAVPSSWPIIVHPDVITDVEQWRFLGQRLCLENMDQRKPIGRTVSEMEAVFHRLPDASFCFDIGHARQVDPTMAISLGLLQKFRTRLRQVHISEVDPQGRHIPIGFGARCAFRRVARFIPEDCPIIIESVIENDKIDEERSTALDALSIGASFQEASNRIASF